MLLCGSSSDSSTVVAVGVVERSRSTVITRYSNSYRGGEKEQEDYYSNCFSLLSSLSSRSLLSFPLTLYIRVSRTPKSFLKNRLTGLGCAVDVVAVVANAGDVREVVVGGRREVVDVAAEKIRGEKKIHNHNTSATMKQFEQRQQTKKVGYQKAVSELQKKIETKKYHIFFHLKTAIQKTTTVSRNDNNNNSRNFFFLVL